MHVQRPAEPLGNDLNAPETPVRLEFRWAVRNGVAAAQLVSNSGEGLAHLLGTAGKQRPPSTFLAQLLQCVVPDQVYSPRIRADSVEGDFIGLCNARHLVEL